MVATPHVHPAKDAAQEAAKKEAALKGRLANVRSAITAGMRARGFRAQWDRHSLGQAWLVLGKDQHEETIGVRVEERIVSSGNGWCFTHTGEPKVNVSPPYFLSRSMQRVPLKAKTFLGSKARNGEPDIVGVCDFIALVFATLKPLREREMLAEEASKSWGEVRDRLLGQYPSTHFQVTSGPAGVELAITCDEALAAKLLDFEKREREARRS